MAGQMQNANTDLFDAYFKRADLDGDGQISGAEAVAFFQGSGLPKQVLAQVWTHADARKAGFLGRQEFYNALKLVTVAQRKRELTPDIVNAALNSPASAKIPAPQINLAATPSPRVATPGPQMTSQNFVVRPPQIPANQPYFPIQHGQFMRPPQPMPPRPVSHTPQVIGSESMPRGGTVVPPRPPSSNVSTDWLGAGMGSATSQILARGVSPSATKNGFGLTAPGLTPSIQTRPQETNGHTQATPSKQQNAVRASQHEAGKDSKSVVVSNGSSPDTIFGDVFSATPAQTTQSSSSASSSTSSMPVSSLTVPSSVGSQASVKPSNLTHQQQIDSHSTGIPSQAITTHNVITSSGIPGVVGNAAPSQSQPPWPKMTQTGIQNYIKVFLQVDVDRDGKITGEQARNLFLSWRLPREILKQVWDLSDQDNDSMLSLREFCIALYLMERYREGRPLPATLPATLPPSIMSDEILLSATNHPIASYGGGTLGPVSVSWQPQVMTGARPPPAPAARPPRPPPASHVDEKQPSQQKPKVPVLEKHIVDQLSQEEQDSLNSKFQEASQADKKVEELEKEISDSRQKMEFYRVKMQELILYKSRCDNRLNEVMERVSADKREVEALAKKYETKYKEAGDVASRLTIEEATFRDIQESKMEVYQAIVKIEEGATGDGVLKERAEHIKSRMEELVKNLNDRCKQYGLRAKPTSLVELPFGWQPGIKEGAADWDEDWDKFEDEGFTFVKELTLDVQNVVAPPKPKSSAVQKETASAQDDLVASPKLKQVESPGKPEQVASPGRQKQVASPGKQISDKESVHQLHENGLVRRPLDSPPARGATEVQSHEFQDSPIRESSSADNSPHAKEIQSGVGGAESVVGGEKSVDEPGWGTFDSHYDTDSLWGGESISGKDMDLGFGEFGLNPIRTGSSQRDNIFPGKSPSIFADSDPSTPAQGRSSYTFADSVPSSPAQGRSSYLFADSVPSTPAYNQGKTSYAFADSVPSTPAYGQGKSPYAFADSVPSTPAYKFGNSPKRYSEGADDHSFDSFSRFDSFSLHDGGLFQSPRHSLTRFDSIRSTSESDQNYGFPSRFDSFREAGDSDQSHGFSRFDSFKDSDTSHGFSKFDSFRDSDNSHGFSKFDSFRVTDHHSQGFPPNFDSFGESRDSDHGLGFPPSFDSFGVRDSGFLPSSSNSQAGFDSVRSSKDADNSHGFSSFVDANPLGSSGPFKTTTIERETTRSYDSWRAF